MRVIISRIGIGLAVLLFAIATKAVALPLASDRPAADIEFQAYWSLELHRPDLAVPFYETILGGFPTYQDRPWAMFHLLRGYLDTGRFDDLFKLADTIEKEYPNTPVAAWAQFEQGVAHERQGDRVKASELYKTVCLQYATLQDVTPILAACETQGNLLWKTVQEQLANPPIEIPIPKSTPEREAAAKAIYDPAKALLFSEVTPEIQIKAMKEFDRLVADYSDTGYLPWAKLRIANANFRLGNYKEAITAAQGVIDDYPGAVPAVWSQVVIGQAYKKMGLLLDAYNAFRKVEEYDYVDDGRPAICARQHVRRFWDALCKENPEIKDIGWPLPNRDLTIANLAALNGNDPNERNDCAWIGACWISIIEPELTFGLFDEMMRSCPEQRTWLAIAAIIGAKHFLDWADYHPGSNAKAGDEERALNMLETVRAIVPKNPHLHVEADLIMAQHYQQNMRWMQAAGVAARGLDEVPGSYCENELACILGNASMHLNRYDDAIRASQIVMRQTNHPGWMWSAMHCRAVALVAQGKLTDAASQFSSLAGMSNSPDWRVLAAEEAADCSLKAGDRSAAIEALRIAVDQLKAEMASDPVRMERNWSEQASRQLRRIESRLSGLLGQAD